MALTHDAWSGPIVQAVDRIYQIRQEIHRLELEEAVLREAVITALAGASDEDFPLRMGLHDVRLQQRAGRVDQASAIQVLAARGLDQELPQVPEILDPNALRQFEEDVVSRIPMSQRSRTHLTAGFKQAVGYRSRVDVETLRGWRSAARISEDEYRACFHDRKSEIFALTIR